ncbi:hypothetical protein SRIMM317S_06997 [Streptomyces rimosus subsp. rimosus]|nr:hypothetical protein [Streptomyces rimosus]
MTILRKVSAVAAALGAGLASAAPAAAGGIIVIGSPSHDNTCANHGTVTQPMGSTSNGNGAAGGLLGQIPIGSALNHCGGADLPGTQNGSNNNSDAENINGKGNQGAQGSVRGHQEE